MKKCCSKAILCNVFVGLLLLAVFSIQSCKQCTSTEVKAVTADTVSTVPQLESINAEIAKDSLNPFLYFKRAQLFEANSDFKSAATDMYLALTLDSLQPEFYLYAAQLFKLTGDLQRGIALMNKAISTDSTNTDFYVKAAELAYIDTTIQANHNLALAYLNEAIAKNPQNADVYFYKGNVYKETGDTAKAISSFQTATELNPKHYNSFVQLGLLLREKKDKNAQKYLDNAIRVNDKPEDALYAKADMLKEEGRQLAETEKYELASTKFISAIEGFKQVVEINHRNVEAYMGIGFSYYQMDSVEEAFKYYEMASKIEPGYAGAYFSMGMCAEDLGRKHQAISLYQSCLSIDPGFTRAKDHLLKLQSAQ